MCKSPGAMRFFSNLMKKGRETFTPKLSSKLNNSFVETFPKSIPDDLTLKMTPQKQSNSSPNYENYTQPGRTYKEELYASRRFELNPSQNPSYAFRKLQTFLQEEKIPGKVREKRWFVRPGLVKHSIIYGGRRKKFNNLVKDTIKRVVQIHESKKE